MSVRGGGFMGTQCYSLVYDDTIIQGLHISQLECYNALIAAHVFLSSFHSVCEEIKCDNSATVCCLATGRGRDYVWMDIARAFWYFAAKRDITFVFTHAPGTSMTIADALSRQHLSPAHAKITRDLVSLHKLCYIHVSPQHCDINDYF